MEELTTSWHSYPKIFALGHSAIRNLLLDKAIVTVEEKVDGSQFSFGKFNGEIKCRSKGVVLNMALPEKMFVKAVETVRSIEDKLVDGWTYRSEYLQSPKHNTLAYERIPTNHLMIFDINTGHEVYMPYAEKKKEADRLGLETVPLVHEGEIHDIEIVREWMDRYSALGAQKIEGLVFKNYKLFAPDGKVAMGKYVSEMFKEMNVVDFKEWNPEQGDIITKLILKYQSPARWEKATQHLRDAGKLKGDPSDIGMLIKEISNDLLAECEDQIKEELLNWAKDNLIRGVIRGFPQWYKERLLRQQPTESNGGV